MVRRIDKWCNTCDRPYYLTNKENCPECHNSLVFHIRESEKNGKKISIKNWGVKL